MTSARLRNSLLGEKSLLPQGFSLDPSNNLFYLCGLPEKFAQRQVAQVEDVVQQNVLRSVAYLSGKKELYEEYSVKLTKNLSDQEGYWRKLHARSGVENALQTLEEALLTNPEALDVKKHLLRFCVFGFESLCLYYGISTSCHTIEKIEALCRKGLFPSALKDLFRAYLEFAFGLRWKAHLAAKEEQDHYELTAEEKKTVSIAYHTLLKPLQETLTLWLNDETALQDSSFFAAAQFAQAEKESGEKEFLKALRSLEQGLALKEDPLYLKLYGKHSFCLGRFSQAQKAWQQCLAGLKETPVLLSEKGEENTAQEEKLLSRLLALAQEEDKVYQALYRALSAFFPPAEVARIAPFSQEEYHLEGVSLEEFSPQDLLPLWQNGLTIWLSSLLQGVYWKKESEFSEKKVLALFSETYTALPKFYRQELLQQIDLLFRDKLGLLKEFFCEEGYIFAAAAKREAWLMQLQADLQAEENPQEVAPFIQSSYLKPGYLSSEPKGKLYRGKEFTRSVPRGKHLVAHAVGSFFKKNPDNAGDEYAVFLLNHLITGQGSPPVEVLCIAKDQPYFTPHFLLASQEISGKPLDLFLDSSSSALAPLDPQQFSQMILMALLTDPEDGHPKNYVAQEGEKTQIYGIDNDHAFVKPFVQKGIVFSEDQLFIKTILFCFDEMSSPIHPEVVERFLQLEPLAVIEKWLEELVRYNQKIGELFPLLKLYQYWKQNSLVPFFMHSDQVLYLYEKMLRLQEFLRKKKEEPVSHLELLKLVNDKVGRLYEQALKKPLNPKQRFDLVTKGAYGSKGETITSTADIKKYILHLDTLKDFQEHSSTPEEGLKVLRHLSQNTQEMENLQQKIHTSWETVDSRQLRAIPSLERMLKNKDWSKEPLSSLGKIKKKPFRKLVLQQFNALTNTALKELLESCVHPLTGQIEIQTLNLKGCSHLQGEAVETIKRYCLKLEKLSLEGWALSEVSFNENALIGAKSSSYLKKLDLRNCSHLTTLTVRSATLKSLYLGGCVSLKNLIVDCPQLQALQIEGCNALVNYQPSLQTPLSVAYFSELKQLIQEKATERHLDRRQGEEKVFAIFLRTLAEDPSLEKLSLTFASNSKEPSTPLCSSGSPTLMELELRGLRNKDLESLARFLANSPKLKQITAIDCILGKEGIKGLIGNAKRPLDLKLFNSTWTQEAITACAAALEMPSSYELYLEGNIFLQRGVPESATFKSGFYQDPQETFTWHKGMGDEKILRILLKALRPKSNLEMLMIDLEGVDNGLTQAILPMGHPHLQSIHFKGVRNGDLQAFAYFLGDSPSLTRIFVEKSAIDKEGMQALLGAAKKELHWKLKDNQITHEGMQVLAPLVPKDFLPLLEDNQILGASLNLGTIAVLGKDQEHKKIPSFTWEKRPGDEKVLQVVLGAIGKQYRIAELELDWGAKKEGTLPAAPLCLPPYPDLEKVTWKGKESLTLFARFFPHCPRLHHFTLEEGVVDKEGMQVFLEGVQPLQYMRMVKTRIEPLGLQELASCLKKTVLSELYLEECALKGPLLKTLSASFEPNAALTTLSLAQNGIGEGDGISLATLLSKSKNLTTLDLSGNLLAQQEALFLSEALLQTPSLRNLDLRGCASLRGKDLEKLVASEQLVHLKLPLQALDYRDPDNQDFLYQGLARGNKKVTEYALPFWFSQGLDPLKDEKGKTLFHIARERKESKILSFFEKIRELEEYAIGKTAWLQYLGDVGEEPLLPPSILEILESPCPIWGGTDPEKKVKDTHILVLIPEKLAGKPWTLDALVELTAEPKEGVHMPCCSLYSREIQRDLGSQSAPSSWVLMTKQTLAATHHKIYPHQLEELDELARASPAFKEAGYRIPRLREVATCLLMEYMRSGKMLYNRVLRDPLITHTFCEERVDQQRWRVVAGGFGADIYLYSAGGLNDTYGLGLIRDLSYQG